MAYRKLVFVRSAAVSSGHGGWRGFGVKSGSGVTRWAISTRFFNPIKLY